MKVREMYPWIEINGKLTEVNGTRFALQPVGEYVPYFISVKELKLKNFYERAGIGAVERSKFSFEATFEAGYKLNDVFLLLELQSVGEAGYFSMRLGD